MVDRKLKPLDLTFHETEQNEQTKFDYNEFCEDENLHQILSFSDKEIHTIYLESRIWSRLFRSRDLPTKRQVSNQSTLESRVDYLETMYKHGIRPTLAAMAKHMRTEKDVLPAASSIEYELFEKLTEIGNIVTSMIEQYTDDDLRLSKYMILVSKLKELVERMRNINDPFFFRGVLMIYDALCCTYAEDLTPEKLILVRDTVATFQEPIWDKDKLRSLDHQLREVGFETIPSDRFHNQL
jgi:hypothetical protein